MALQETQRRVAAERTSRFKVTLLDALADNALRELERFVGRCFVHVRDAQGFFQLLQDGSVASFSGGAGRKLLATTSSGSRHGTLMLSFLGGYFEDVDGSL